MTSEHFASATRHLNARARSARDSGGRDGAVLTELIRPHLPALATIDAARVTSRAGDLSDGPELVIVDGRSNPTLFPGYGERLRLLESVYAQLDVRARLEPEALADAMEKCRRFKSLPREFADVPSLPKVRESLYVLWAWECDDADAVRDQLQAAVSDVPRTQQPDFVLVPDRLVVTGGSYLELVKFGRPGNAYRRRQEEALGQSAESYLAEHPVEVWDTGSDTLLVWLAWLTSWLRAAGGRSAPLESYLEQCVRLERVE